MRKFTAALALSSVLFTTACFADNDSAGTAEGGESTGGDNRVSVASMSEPSAELSPLSDDAFMLSQWATGETLVRLDENGDAEALLAESWTQEDPTTWRFTIREGVTFHDGTELTADRVAEALNFANDASPRPRVLDSVEYTFEADGSDVIVTTAEEDPLVPQVLSAPNLMIFAEGAYSDGVITPVGYGTGPFELISFDTTTATLNAYADYWGDAPALDGIDAEFVTDPTARSAALRTGTDLVGALPVASLSELDPETVVEVAMPRTTTLHLNNDSGPFADPAIRAAALAAIDKAGLVENVFEGYGDAAEGLFGPALPWAADFRAEPDYEAEMANQPEPASPEEVNGTEITLATYTGRAELPELAVRLEQELEDAGFVVTQDVREYDYIEADALDGAFDAFILSRGVVLDSGDPVAFLTSDYSCDGSYNLSLFCDPAVDELIDVAASTAPGTERQKAIMDVEAALMSRIASIPLVNERGLQGESTRVSNAERDPLSRRLVTEYTTVE